MEINLNNVGKRYRFEWIIKGLTYTFKQGGTYAILGPNGSGKSTLMRMLSGYLTPSKGTIKYWDSPIAKTNIDIGGVYKCVSYAAPYIDLIEELTLSEAIRLHQRFKPFYKGTTANDIHELLQFSKSKYKPIQFFSSGMKQRLKLVLACASDTPLILLDEPTTNLDEQGIEWYLRLIQQFALDKDRTTIVASNIEHDYSFCNEHIHILDYKNHK